MQTGGNYLDSPGQEMDGVLRSPHKATVGTASIAQTETGVKTGKVTIVRVALLHRNVLGYYFYYFSLI